MCRVVGAMLELTWWPVEWPGFSSDTQPPQIRTCASCRLMRALRELGYGPTLRPLNPGHGDAARMRPIIEHLKPGAFPFHQSVGN